MVGKDRETERETEYETQIVMKNRILLCIAAWISAGSMECTARPLVEYPSTARFRDAVNHWNMDSRARFFPYERYAEDQVAGIADNLVAYQNGDGGWMKNIDWLAVLDADSVRSSISEHRRKSTLDNSNTYSQVEYLARAYTLLGDERYAAAARRGIEYMLAHQYANGGWRGSDVDAITFNDNVMCGVLETWYAILRQEPEYAWVDAELRGRIADSWQRGIDLVLRCQYVQHGVRTVWGQQHDHETLLPVKARSYELPGLTAGESAGIVLMLMKIEKPSPEIVEAVRSAVAWFGKTRIDGVRIRTVEVPLSEREDPRVAVDRIEVPDSTAPPLWARYYELEDNKPFLCRRDGTKVYRLADVNHERRAGYGWYGQWAAPVLEQYPEWLRKNGLAGE